MNLENSAIFSGILEEFKEDVTWLVFEIDLRHNKNYDEHAERIKTLEKKLNKVGYFLQVFYQDKNRKGLYHLHFVKPGDKNA